MRDIKILMHTHWDREWYFTKDETQVLLRNHMFEVIEFLEKNDDVIYILDGQSVMIDDFIEFAPKWKDRLQHLVQLKKLRVGPWYTQTDLLLVHGESIIRNLYYGMKKAMEYGDVMKVGYAPDTFGHSSQMPQIYNLFGIESSFFWRGFSELKSKKSDFLWKGIDGSIIFGINLATGYQGAKYLESDPKELKVRMNKILNVLDNYSATNSRLIMNGHDQMPIQKNIFEIIENLKNFYPEDSVSITDFEGYVKDLEMKKDELDLVAGELIHSKHSRIHKTITSTRMDIKLLNTELEYKLYNILEPLAILATELNYDYPHEIFEKCYKILFGAHAHDSIGGCNSDSVNRDIKQRLIQVKEIVDTQIELYMRLISLAGQENNENIITLYNFLPNSRQNEYVELEMITRTSDFILLNENQEIDYLILEQEIVDAGLIDRQVAARLLDIKVFKTRISFKIDSIPGLSVKYLSYREGNSFGIKENKRSENSINNDLYEIYIEANKIYLFDKTQNRKYEDIISIESSGDAGDSYDYSPPVKDLIIDSKSAMISDIFTKKSKDEERISFKVMYNLPRDEQAREEKNLNGFMSFNVTLGLMKDSNKVTLSIECENKVEDSRFRIVFNPQIDSNVVESDSHLCVIEKPIYFHQELEIWEKEKWSEKPVSIETYNSYVSLKDSEREGTIYTFGLKEYEAKDGKIFITLYRTFSHLGKRELVNRPGRPSGIEIETPDNQLLDTKFEFKMALSLRKPKINNSIDAKEFLTPIAGYQLKEFNRFNINKPNICKKLNSNLELNLEGAVVSCIKLSETSEDIFIRIFNPMNDSISLNFKENVFKSNVFEETLEKISKYTLKTQEILNLIIKRD